MFFFSSRLQSESVKYFLDNLDRIGQLVSHADKLHLKSTICLFLASSKENVHLALFSELHPEQAGHFVCAEGDQRHRGARLCHQEDSLQDGGCGRAEVPEAEVVSVFRRDHVDTLHGFVVGVRSGTVRAHF